jgi:hypothetical protein
MYISEHYCKNCGTTFQGTDKDIYCNDCTVKIQKEKIEKALIEWRGNLPIEERIAKIEEWIIRFKDHEHSNPLTTFY